MTIYRCCRWQENIFIETDRVNIVPGTRSYGPKGSNIVRNSMKSTKICRMIGTKKKQNNMKHNVVHRKMFIYV